MADSIKRVHYFDHQFLHVDDFTDEQNYHLGMRRRHNRLLHTWGIAEGLQVESVSGGGSVTVRTGSAIDNEGREIVLTNERSVDLSTFPENAGVYLTIAYNEEQTDETEETGVSGNTRWTETPLIEAAENAPEDSGLTLILARVARTGTVVSNIDNSVKDSAGVVGGDLEVQSLTLADPNVVSTSWSHIRLGAAMRTDVEGSLRVTQNATVEGNLEATGTITGDLATNSVGADQLSNNAVIESKLANNAVSGQKIQNGAVSGVKIADRTINESKLDNATRGKLVSNGDSHNHSGGDGARIRHGHLDLNDGRNPHGTTADDVGALPSTGGRLSGELLIRHRSNESAGISIILTGDNHSMGGVRSILFRPRPPINIIPITPPSAVIGYSEFTNTHGVYARAPSGTHALFVSGTARFTGNKTGYVVDTFVNASGKTLRTGDVVILKGSPIARFEGDNNKIPVPEVALTSKASDKAVIGIVDREAIPDHGSPDTRVGADDPTFIEDGGELFVVTLGTYAHCKVDAAEAPIEVGDLLTSSTNPGHARKATDPKIGCIIGKALEPFKEGTGYIAVFVNIQ